MKFWPLIFIFGLSLPLLIAGEKAPPGPDAAADKADAAGKKPKPTRPDRPDRNARPDMGGAAKAIAAKDARDKAKAAAAKDAADGDDKDAGGDAKTRDAGEAAMKDKDDDNVEMITGSPIYGKIHKEYADSIVMLLRKDIATIKIPRDKIKALNYSMATRLNAVEKDDIAGRYKVGQWALEKNMYPEVIKLFEEIKTQTQEGKEGAGPNLLKELGRAYEQRQQLDKAFENYSAYLESHPDDSEVTEIVKRLTPLVKPKDPEVAAAAPKPVDGLEADGNWQAEGWNNANPSTCAFTTDKQGNKMIIVQSPGGAHDKLAFSRYCQPPLNLSDSTEMLFKAYNDTDKPIKIACAFVNSEGDFHETIQYPIPSKTWFKQSIKIDGKVFKSNRNQFKEYNQELSGKENIVRITFMIYNQRPAKLFVDSLFFK